MTSIDTIAVFQQAAKLYQNYGDDETVRKMLVEKGALIHDVDAAIRLYRKTARRDFITSFFGCFVLGATGVAVNGALVHALNQSMPIVLVLSLAFVTISFYFLCRAIRGR